MQTIQVKSPSGYVDVAVSDEDYDDLALLKWHLAGGKGGGGKYAASRRRDGGRAVTVYMHRLVAARMGLIVNVSGAQSGKWSHSIDHANGDKFDNRRENLRLKDRPSQMRNPNDRPRSTNKSGYRGVSFVASRERFGKPWMAYVTVNYKTYNLGWYATVEEAAAARAKWEAEHNS